MRKPLHEERRPPYEFEMMRVKTCPICKKPILPRAENPAFPFCGPRCRAVDLGKWLGEEYRVATGFSEESEDERPQGTGELEEDA